MSVFFWAIMGIIARIVMFPVFLIYRGCCIMRDKVRSAWCKVFPPVPKKPNDWM
ncbi:hypothetical protein LI168_03130 [Desulfovibrio desulfuricans]|uniref:hypothetical protein n=1 Tax=Desulfovibrio desulfuricans TaxID=876 RepID=UPI001D07C2E4|nr:hypothetical protein [Desulfovibrio desulfuricans]MCB6541129.1 hypothetical protein [Desulfovibrio desulfuricans]MCB6552211.1 hypothetical protein [Desulfovibrio desulfuricans]MCB6564054.1 hypothetical protein [Desulfovibrio desulfuricans]MCB7345234.1 hypothetical protein [Desulfovibrio desulfuricans]MCQ5217312.1 hypothetical protein [Desulfovibrio desulfuricans]